MTPLVTSPRPSSIALALGKTIKLRRVEMDLTQEQLAERCEFDRTFISQIERGIREPSLKHLRNLANALNTLASSLIQDSELREQQLKNQPSLAKVAEQKTPYKGSPE